MRLRARLRRGMTMIEIMVVVTVIAVLMGVAIPTMTGVNERNRLRSSSRQIMNLMKYARAEAILNQSSTSFFLDLKERQYWLDFNRTDEKTGKPLAAKKRSLYEQKQTLDRDVWFDEVVAVDDNIIDDKFIAIDFYPDGSASPTAITLVNRKQKRMTVELLKASGMAEVSNGTLADKRAKEAEEAAQCATCPK